MANNCENKILTKTLQVRHKYAFLVCYEIVTVEPLIKIMGPDYMVVTGMSFDL